MEVKAADGDADAAASVETAAPHGGAATSVAPADLAAAAVPLEADDEDSEWLLENSRDDAIVAGIGGLSLGVGSLGGLVGSDPLAPAASRAPGGPPGFSRAPGGPAGGANMIGGGGWLGPDPSVEEELL